jgi:hypothetical protein
LSGTTAQRKHRQVDSFTPRFAVLGNFPLSQAKVVCATVLEHEDITPACVWMRALLYAANAASPTG